MAAKLFQIWNGASVTTVAPAPVATGTSVKTMIQVATSANKELRLAEFWGDESRAHKGVGIPGFPNLFCLAGPNTGLVAIGSQTFMCECAINYVAECLRHLFVTGAAAIEPTQEAYRLYVKWIEEGNRGMAWAAVPEQSWYRNASGTNTVVWPYPLLTYYELTRRVDEDEMVVTYPASQEMPV